MQAEQGRERLRKSARNVVPGQREPFRAAGGAGAEKPKWKRGEKDRSSAKGGVAHSSPASMVPGRVNRGTISQSVDRNIVQPVVRGGAAPRPAAGGARRKQQRKELKKVTLPSTVRLENLTNLLGVKLCELGFFRLEF